MKNTALQAVIKMPIFVASGIVVSLIIQYVVHQELVASVVMIITIVIGFWKFLLETIKALLKHKFGLDYIALCAVIVSFITQDYLVGGMIVLMLTTGEALEKYAMLHAKKSLTSLIDRIPKDVTLLDDSDTHVKTTIEEVKIGQRILIRRGEVIPLDGTLESASGYADESSLTGEPYYMDKLKGDVVRSGTINAGDVMVINVTTADDQSTYRKIIKLVQEAESSQAPLVRLADRYSTIFTLLTAIIAGTAYFFTRDVEIILAVLVVATPCPLILATPIALIGGMSAAARQKIIMKNLASIEVLSRTQALIFDKTGTITLGHPVINQVEVKDTVYSEEKILGIATAIEHNSLHPFAKAIVQHTKDKNISIPKVEKVEEVVGIGISGMIDGQRYTLAKYKNTEQLTIEVTGEGKLIALLHFEDQVKLDSKQHLDLLEQSGFEMYMLTGDKQTVADALVKSMGINISVQGNCSPEDKLARLRELQKSGKVTAMVGDGINDAPALAAADVGIVFANEEHTAASDAADVVLLGGDFTLVLRVFNIAKRTIKIALQSIWVGIGLSVLSMIAAAFGWIPPLIGSLWQECIDVIVIINALRAARG
ncbi:MAG: heavy metal translocating P-type ATPase [Patescibacteria group bacterium]